MLVALWVRVGVLEANPRNIRSRDWSRGHKVLVHLVTNGWEEASKSALWLASVSLRSGLIQDHMEYLELIRMRWSAAKLETAVALVTLGGTKYKNGTSATLTTKIQEDTVRIAPLESPIG